MVMGFFDDTEVSVDSEDSNPDIYIFGGYLIPSNQIYALLTEIQKIKASFGLPVWMPIKWNIKDSGISSFIKDYYHLLDERHLDIALTYSDEIRSELLKVLSQFNIKVFISGRYDRHHKEATSKDYSHWAFENLLQRVGIFAQNNKYDLEIEKPVQLIIDWPKPDDKTLFNHYFCGYHFGNGREYKSSYLSGPLKIYGFVESISVSSTIHNSYLQIADLVVGCSKDFLSWCYTGKQFQRISGKFDALIDLFYRDTNRRINKCGFVLAKDEIDIDAKIAEYLEKRHQEIILGEI